MKKLIAVVVSVLLFCIVLAGCAAPAANPTDSQAPVQTSNANNLPSGSISASYTAYLEAKGAMLTKLSNGLTTVEPMAAMNLLGLSMIDLALLPISVFGQDQAGIETGLAMMGISDIHYQANGNTFTMSYKDEEGISTLFETTYDPGTDFVSTTVSQEGKEVITFEYCKTSYGYASQYYMNNDDGTFSLYKGTYFNGSDGVVGITNAATSAPPALTAGAPQDFPKDCDSWYAVEGNSGTGVNEEGANISFTVPEPTP